MEIQHVGHKHPLVLVDMERETFWCSECSEPVRGPKYKCVACDIDKQIRCCLCGDLITTPAYGCTKCYLFLHKSCAEKPQHLEHPFHPIHPLSLHLDNTCDVFDRCDICLREFCFMDYHCDVCGFVLDRECASLTPSTKFSYENHLLFLYDDEPDPYAQRTCAACGLDCRDECAPIFVCAVPLCDYSVHFHCVPFSLPEIIHHNCHLHTLTLTKSLPGDSDSDYFVCDACEKQRNPNHPVYYCEECDFIVHVHCAISQVLPSLITEYENDARAQGVYPVDIHLEQLNLQIASLTERQKEVAQEIEAVNAEIEATEAENARPTASSIAHHMEEKCTIGA